MIYLAWSILLFELLRLLISLSNLLFFQRLPKTKADFSGLVSVLIPARNEEKNIENLLNDLIAQDYKEIEIIVFNDQSTDNTRNIIMELSKTNNRIKLIDSDYLPEGWIGKNFACHTLAQQAKGNYFLFLDADVRVGRDTISRSVSYIQKYKLGLLSIFPRQIMLSIGEWLTVPVMNYILLSLLPLFLVRISGFKSLAAANGQFMLFDSEVYRKYYPHQLLKNNKVEDIETVRFFKRKREKTACLITAGSVECRMYQEFEEAIQGFSKNIIGYFGNSYFVAMAFWLITTFGFLAVLAGLPFEVFALYIAAIILSKLIISIVSRQSILRNLLYHLPHQIAIGMFIYKAIENKTKKQYQWKGRYIS